MKFTLYTADCTGNAKNTIYPHQKVITSEADLKKAVAFDHVCALYDNFSRSDTNFQLSDVVPMDCDNDHSDDTDEWITPEKLSEMLTDVAFAVTYSRHHMLAKGSVSARPRFHVFFPTTPCKDATFHKAIKARIYKELPFFDGNALDASRFLFGSKSEVVWHEGSLTIEDWLTLMKSNRSIPEGQRNSTLSRIAGRLVKRFGVTDEARQKFLDKAAECNPPLDDTELESIWNSACKFGSKVTSQDGYVPPDQFGQNPLLPDDFSDVGEARTFVDCFGEEITFTVATNYLRYNGVYWEESEQAAVMAMIEHTDAQLSDAESKMEEHLCALEKLGVPRMLAKAGGKKFRDSLNPEQGAAYGLFRFSEIYHDFVMKYRNIRSLNNALDAAKPLVLKHPEQLDGNPMLLNTILSTFSSSVSQILRNQKHMDPSSGIASPGQHILIADRGLTLAVQAMAGLCAGIVQSQPDAVGRSRYRLHSPDRIIKVCRHLVGACHDIDLVRSVDQSRQSVAGTVYIIEHAVHRYGVRAHEKYVRQQRLPEGRLLIIGMVPVYKIIIRIPRQPVYDAALFQGRASPHSYAAACRDILLQETEHIFPTVKQSNRKSVVLQGLRQSLLLNTPDAFYIFIHMIILQIHIIPHRDSPVTQRRKKSGLNAYDPHSGLSGFTVSSYLSKRPLTTSVAQLAPGRLFIFTIP